MKVLKVLTAVVMGAFISTSLFADFKAGAEFYTGFFYQTGSGAKKSKPNMSYKHQKMDLHFTFMADKTKAFCQIDPLNPGLKVMGALDDKGNLDYSGSGLSSMVDDAWIQYKFHPMFALKLGHETSFYSTYGWYSSFFAKTHFKPSTKPKMEFSGAHASGFSYGLQFWEDIKANTMEDDRDAGIGTNMSLQLKYKMPILEAGMNLYIDHPDKGAKQAMGYQAFLKYMNKAPKMNVWLVYTQAPQTSKIKGDQAVKFGASYNALHPIDINFGLDYLTPSAGDKMGDAGMAIDFNVFYSFNKAAKYYVQVVNYGEKFAGTAEAYTVVGTGVKAKF